MNEQELLDQAAAQAQQGGAPQGPPRVPPQPMPAAFALQVVDFPMPNAEGGAKLTKLVALEISMPTGVTIVFLEPDNAVNLADGLQHSARSAKTGLTVVGQP